MKPIYKWIIGGVILIVFIVGLSVVYGYYQLKKEVPKYGDKIKLTGLENTVEVVYDKWGVPHVFGSSEKDLVRALGYLHARDRLWQMDLVRRAAAGRLSEIFGEFAYDIDVSQRIMGLERFAKDAVSKLDEETLSVLQAYSDGVNAFIASQPEYPTIEFRVIGYKMELWKPSDIIMLARMTAWTLSANMTEEILRYALVSERGEEVAWKLMPRHEDPGPFIIPPEEKKYGQGAFIRRPTGVKTASYPVEPLLKLLEVNKLARQFTGFSSSGFASNSWVVAPSKTASGGAILCNDPHLELLLPSVWHEAHLSAGNINVAGVAFPGTPFIVLGHTPKIAWGATTTVADTQDLYILKTDPQDANKYLYNGEWLPFDVVEEKIKVRLKKGYEERIVKVRISKHGPVVTDNLKGLPKNLPPLALRWAGYEVSNEIKALLNVAKATSWEEYLKAMQDFKVPVQNWVYADANGNIGYIANGLLPIRKKGDGTLPVPGDDPSYEWQGYVPQEELPQLYNPKSGFIATANNKVVPEEDYPYIVSYRYAPPYRAMRIVEVLSAGNKLSLADMSKLQMDTKLMLGQRLAKYFIEAYEKKGNPSNPNLANLVNELKRWDFSTGVESIATLFFLESYRQAFRLTYEDEMSNELFENFREDTNVWSGFDNGIESDFELFDDRRTQEVERRDDILVKAMTEAITTLSKEMGEDTRQWRWGKRHQILFNHPFGSINPTLRKIFSVGPFELAGARDTVNNGFFNWFTAPYIVYEGPSMRHLVDFGKFEESRITITVGQSLHRLSPHYSDQVSDWLAGGGHPMPMSREGVDKIAEGTITFVP